MAGGTGSRFSAVITTVAGVASLIATLLSALSIWLQIKNYRKPLLQRYVVRILLMVPIYSLASWTSMISLEAAAFLDPVRDIYEAFTIYTFFQLLINYRGGERSIIITTHGRAPVQHLWPLNHVLSKVDISDPKTFLLIKRGILQYAWLKPILSIAAIIMKATGTYQEGYIAVSSGYFWSGILYNISVTLSLYFLGLFWVCMHKDLQPFRPVPKFLCIKLIIFASYWQGFFLSILVWIGAIPDDVEGYTPNNLAAAIQDALICLEMPAFAIAHWYAFSWHDFADNSILSARMPLNFALRDSFGIRDLIEDSKDTFNGDRYAYRDFDSGDRVMAHEDSKSRFARLKDGMRYERGGKGKYWIPKPGQVTSKTPLLATDGSPSQIHHEYSHGDDHGTFEEPEIDAEEERLYSKARQLEFGDWNYPVITANEPLRERYISSAGNFTVYSPVVSAPPARSSGVKPPTSKGKQKSTDGNSVATAKRAAERTAVHHDEPDTSKPQLNNDASSSAGETAHPNKPSESDDEDGQDHSPGYDVSGSEEFRNVWDGNGSPR
ncbi:hypothetical protein S7711_00807 [Stachybotrys chartarum IBT 7711]|uniref:DUF300 domain protein n=1 Tax=Stachybotrys chartarum (strain CBS 109288 / IBT 7711) TaxID=1280523 RepID=A0A084B091_STACB|nr:hypothetical protein S7711_00807 [Stachybotrys chartarum IBT 7711]KFA49011.1 hypothetical protein S40293_06207 [Stachybotrys chartarum IBT 40293]KFA72484.1 hypothetical protein S40288_06650 [Stachybotrys chartarum IBT 40288]